MGFRRSLLGALRLLVTALTLHAFHAHAAEAENDRARARALGYAGVRAYGAGDYPAASAQLEQAYEILPVPSLGLWSARASAKLGKLLEAEQRYREVAAAALLPDAPAVQHAARHTAQLELAELAPRIPRLRVRVLDAGAHPVSVSIDGVFIGTTQSAESRLVNPGPHEVSGRCGAERSAVSLMLEEGGEREAVLRFSGCAAPPPPPPWPLSLGEPPAPDPWRVPAWVSVGAGGASLALSGAAYYLARREHHALQADGTCDDERCRPGADLQGYSTFRAIHLATLVTGAVLGAAGVTLLLLDPGPPASAGGPGSRRLLGASFSGRF